MNRQSAWPDLTIAAWEETRATLHMWTQVVGKIRTTLTPWINHSWHTTLHATPRGLTTLAIPHGRRTFQIDFDFKDHQLVIAADDGKEPRIELEPISVATFYERVMSTLDDMGLSVEIYERPNEVDPAIPFAKNQQQASYDPLAVERLHNALLSTHRVMTRFRSGFRGKCSPVHFFWGSFDLAVTRFSGRLAPPHPGGFPNMPDWITREAYSHEVSSCGFWPGGGEAEAIFYCYAYPEPEGFSSQPVQPHSAAYSKDMSEFVLPYEAIRNSASPEEDLLAFFQSSYEAAAESAKWDRHELEWSGPPELKKQD